MKVFKISLCFFIIFCFASCGTNEFCNIYSFVDNYNTVSTDKISVTDFYFDNPGSSQYTAVLGNPNEEITIEINSSSDALIEEIKISLIKNRATPPSQQQAANFLKILSNSLYAYCHYSETECTDIINAFELNLNDTYTKEGELTLKRGNFYFIYYSTDLISRVTVINTYLKKIEVTEKPVSKPYYAEDFIIKETP